MRELSCSSGSLASLTCDGITSIELNIFPDARALSQMKKYILLKGPWGLGKKKETKQGWAATRDKASREGRKSK